MLAANPTQENPLEPYSVDRGDTSPTVHTFNNLPGEPNENGHGSGPNDHPNLTQPNPSLELGEILNWEHQRMLQGSGISLEVVKTRRYRSVETKSELRRLGFADAQCNTPGMLVPIYSPAGEVVNYQFRPDRPRIRDGKPVKYETPRGSQMSLDVHPFAREKLGDPSVPLWITEGVKKGDALASRGLCVVALLGVWSWRGTNEQGGKTALPEWEHIALNDRKVYIVFDSDVMLKSQVHAALARLKAFLEVR
jgi:hypothetical protein